MTPRRATIMAIAAALPLLAAGCDWLENAGLLVLLALYPQQVPVLAATLGVITPVKLALVQLSFLALAVAVAVAAAAAMRRLLAQRLRTRGAPTMRLVHRRLLPGRVRSGARRTRSREAVSEER